MPDEIPVPTVVGTRVTAKVNPEGNGLRLFTGTVDAVDTTNNTFRVGFERYDVHYSASGLFDELFLILNSSSYSG